VGWNKIELCGRVVREPELRATPSGQLLLRFPVDCGKVNQKLEIEVLVLGDSGRELERKLAAGSEVRISGELTARRRNSVVGLSEVSFTVMASQVVAGSPACGAEESQAVGRAGANQASSGLGSKIL
jgi:primosomal replication protein N